MLRHLIKYNFKSYLGDKNNLIWNFIFPFAYMIIFSVALFSLTDGGKPVTIRVAVVPANTSESIADKTLELKNFFKFDGDEGVWIGEDLEHPAGSKETLILYTQANEADSLDWLKNEKIDAIIAVDEELNFKVKPGTSLAPTVLHEVLASFEKINKTQNAIIAGYQDGRFIPLSDSESEEVEANRFIGIDKTARHTAVYSQLIYFFSALAYITYFPINSGVHIVESIEPDQSDKALRKYIGPVSKVKHFFGALIPHWISHLLLIILLFGFTQLIKIDYGKDYPRIILLLLLGTSSAVFTGTALGALLRGKIGLKIALGISIPLIFALASGMMASPLHSFFMEHIPWLHNWNPLGMISNGLYSLYTGESPARYYRQLAGLGIFSLICFVLTIFGIRKTSYESI